LGSLRELLILILMARGSCVRVDGEGTNETIDGGDVLICGRAHVGATAQGAPPRPRPRAERVGRERRKHPGDAVIHRGEAAFGVRLAQGKGDGTRVFCSLRPVEAAAAEDKTRQRCDGAKARRLVLPSAAWRTAVGRQVQRGPQFPTVPQGLPLFPEIPSGFGRGRAEDQRQKLRRRRRRSAFGVRRSAFGVRRSAFGVRRSAFGVRRSAFGAATSRRSAAADTSPAAAATSTATRAAATSTATRAADMSTATRASDLHRRVTSQTAKPGFVLVPHNHRPRSPDSRVLDLLRNNPKKLFPVIARLWAQ